MSSIPFKYLGYLIGGNSRREGFRNLIIDKIKFRLSRWKGKVLSMAGRLLKASISVCKSIRKLRARVLLVWGHKSRKIAWVSWEKLLELVRKNMQTYGRRWLDIKDIGRFNSALLAKWELRLGMEERGLWRGVLESRYGQWRNMDDNSMKKNILFGGGIFIKFVVRDCIKIGLGTVLNWR